MPKTILITGSSSGIGRAAAVYFQQKGWNVAATMRRPEREKDLKNLDRLHLFRLDVTEEESIGEALRAAIAVFGGIDVLVNNAGYGACGIFEASSKDQIVKQFDVNLFGLMEVTRAILPIFREKREGVLINVSSVAGHIAFPLYSLYIATKWAVEGFSESLMYEVRPFGIRVKLIEPGVIKTDFFDRSLVRLEKEGLEEYEAYAQPILEKMWKSEKSAPPPEVVAKKIHQAATDNSARLRYPVGGAAPALVMLRRLIPDRLYFRITRSLLEGRK